MVVHFKKLTCPTQKEYKQIRHIYESNFPSSERKPFETLIHGLKVEQYDLLVLLNPEDIIGLAFLMRLPNINMMFLEYIAIIQDLQSTGLGSELFRFMIDIYKKNTAYNAIVWETELPEEKEEAFPNRRIRWYERLGARVIPMTHLYAMPNYEIENGESVPLQLMWFPTKERNKLITLEETIKIIENIYHVAYPEEMALCLQIIEKIRSQNIDPGG